MLGHIICTVLQLCVLFTYGTAQSAENFYVEDLSWCPSLPDQVIKIFVSFLNSSENLQKVDANLSTPLNLGENQLLTALIETKVTNRQKKWIKMFELKDDFCQAFKMYVGEFGYQLQRASGILPGTCPMRKGNYHVNNIELNFRQLKLQAFPFGNLKITIKIKDKYSSTELACFIAIITNNPRK